MGDIKGQILSREEFISKGQYGKEQYEGLLVCSDQAQGCYNIGVELGNNRILVVDQAKETNIRERIQLWASQIDNIQREYHTRNELHNYSGD